MNPFLSLSLSLFLSLSLSLSLFFSLSFSLSLSLSDIKKQKVFLYGSCTGKFSDNSA